MSTLGHCVICHRSTQTYSLLRWNHAMGIRPMSAVARAHPCAKIGSHFLFPIGSGGFGVMGSDGLIFLRGLVAVYALYASRSCMYLT